MQRTVLVATALLLLPVAGAAPADEGGPPTVSPENPTLAWEGSSFGSASVSSPCSEEVCDHVPFHVDLGSNETDRVLEVSIRWPSEDEDFDLYLYDEAGEVVDASVAEHSRGETVVLSDPAHGTYEAVVVPFDVGGSSYEGLVQLEAAKTGQGALLPDLVPRPADDLHVYTEEHLSDGTVHTAGGATSTSCYPSEMRESGAARCLRFSNTVANLGEGPLDARYPLSGDGDPERGRHEGLVQRIYHANGTYTDHAAGASEYHDAHEHVHYDGFAQHRLYHAWNDTLARTGEKMSFCMMDVSLERWNESGATERAYTLSMCDSPSGDWMVQGISPGWADIYDWTLTDQYIDITGLAEGCYRLETMADPGQTFREQDTSNNRASVRLWLADGFVVPGGC